MTQLEHVNVLLGKANVYENGKLTLCLLQLDS